MNYSAVLLTPTSPREKIMSSKRGSTTSTNSTTTNRSGDSNDNKSNDDSSNSNNNKNRFPPSGGQKRDGRGNRRLFNQQQQHTQGAPWHVSKRAKFNGGQSSNTTSISTNDDAVFDKDKNNNINNKKKNNDNDKQDGTTTKQVFCPMDLGTVFPKLDQSDPSHARRIQQRRKQIQMGKNTLGYAEYLRRVPKDKRRSRSMKTPSTPDHTLDIPAKRWQGIVKSWRKSLHYYDPKDAADTYIAATGSSIADDSKSSTAAGTLSTDGTSGAKNINYNSTQSRQIEQAVANGLLVDVSTTTTTPQKSAPATENDAAMDSPFSVLSEASPAKNKNNVLMDCLENSSKTNTASLRWGDMSDDDSDDDDDDLL